MFGSDSCRNGVDRVDNFSILIHVTKNDAIVHRGLNLSSGLILIFISRPY